MSRNLVELIRRHHTVEAATALEKEGTFINAERRFQVVEPAIDPPGEARTDFEIIGEVSRRLGHEMGWRDPWDALDGIARPCQAPGDAADDDFPLILVTGRILQHYDAGTMTRRTGNARLVDRDVLEIHPVDAERLWIGDGDRVSVRSRVGRIEVEAKVTDRIEPGHVFTSFHFPETRTNLLAGQSADVNTSCPEYKVIAVDVRPISEESSFVPVLADVG